MQQENLEVNVDGPEQSVEQNDLEENKSSAKIDDGDGISAGYGVLQDVDNLLIIKNLKIAETHEKETNQHQDGRNIFEQIQETQKR